MPSYWTTELRNCGDDSLVASILYNRSDVVGVNMEPKPRKFWMVLGAGAPVYRHQTLASAKAEAERLARLNRNFEFTVLEAVSRCRASDVSWDELVDHKEVPF